MWWLVFASDKRYRMWKIFITFAISFKAMGDPSCNV